MFSKTWAYIDYNIVLTIISFLPFKIGRAIAKKRGTFYSKIKRDWRSSCFDDVLIYKRTFNAMKELLGVNDPFLIKKALIKRYESQSIEEWEAKCIIMNRIREWDFIYENEKDINSELNSGRGVVLVTAHYGSSILGSVFLKNLKTNILAMSSDIVENPKVFRSINKFYMQKYLAISNHLNLNGGQVLHKEKNTRQFLAQLKKQGSILILGDLPPSSNEKYHWINVLDKKKAVASGAVSLASKANVSLFSYICVYHEGQYVVRFSSKNQDPYDFLIQQIIANPGLWWAADLLPLFPQGE